MIRLQTISIGLFLFAGCIQNQPSATVAEDFASSRSETVVAMAEPNAEPQRKEEADATGMVRDLKLIRKTIQISSQPPVRASSAEASEAASRIFSRVILTKMSRENVLWMLGDPRTISDYGRAADSKADSPLIYRFDSGFGGWDYIIEFKDKRVTNVRKEGFD